MLRVDLRSAKQDMELALPVRHPQAANQVLLKVGYGLETGTIDRLLQLGVRTIWVRYPALDYLEKYVDSEVVQAQAQVISEVTDTFEQVHRKSTAKMNYDAYTSSIDKMVDALVNNPQAAIFLGDMAGGDGKDMIRHASTVAYLSLLIGLKLEGYLVKQRKHVDPSRAKEVNSLGLGAILHDMGILHLEDEVARRYRETGDDTDAPFREHTALGYQIVRGNIEPSAATVVLNHHQRVDGSGYGGSQVPVLEGTRIHIFARIVALADYFDEVQYPVNDEPIPAATVLKHLLADDVAGRFDEQVLRALFTVVSAFAPGSMLQLSDERYAVAIDHNTNEPCRPTVQIIPPPDSLATPSAEPGETIDLAEGQNGLHVVTCDGQPVADDLFELPDHMRSDMLAAQW